MKNASTATAGLGALTVCRNRGFGSLKDHIGFDDARCVAMCDIDRGVLEDRAAEVNKDYNQTPQLYNYYRKMLQQKDIDEVPKGTAD